MQIGLSDFPFKGGMKAPEMFSGFEISHVEDKVFLLEIYSGYNYLAEILFDNAELICARGSAVGACLFNKNKVVGFVELRYLLENYNIIKALNYIIGLNSDLDSK